MQGAPPEVLTGGAPCIVDTSSAANYLGGFVGAPVLSAFSILATSAFTSDSTARIAPVGGDSVPVLAPEPLNAPYKLPSR